MNKKIKIYKSDVWVLLIFVLVCAGIATNIGLGMLAYLDEMFELLMCFLIAIALIKGRYNTTDFKVFSLCALLLAIGLTGNFVFKYQTQFSVIILDILATFKGVIYYLGIKALNYNSNKSKFIIYRTYKIFYLFVLLMLPFAILNQVIDIGMSHEVVFGIKGFSFLASNEGSLSLIFYAIVTSSVCHIAICQTITQKQKIQCFIIMLVWASTLRSRAIAYVLLFVLMVFIFFKKKNFNGRIHIWQIILICLILYLVGQDKIYYYFANDKTARYNLLYYGWFTLKRCFPLGAGFGTYGSAVASKYYSPLYKEYGFNNIYGLAEENSMFANDGLWGELFGQFGFFGTFIFVLIFATIFKSLLKKSKDQYSKFAIIYILFILTIGSIGTKTTMHFVIVPCFIILAFFDNYLQAKKSI